MLNSTEKPQEAFSDTQTFVNDSANNVAAYEGTEYSFF